MDVYSPWIESIIHAPSYNLQSIKMAFTIRTRIADSKEIVSDFIRFRNLHRVIKRTVQDVSKREIQSDSRTCRGDAMIVAGREFQDLEGCE